MRMSSRSLQAFILGVFLLCVVGVSRAQSLSAVPEIPLEVTAPVYVFDPESHVGRAKIDPERAYDEVRNTVRVVYEDVILLGEEMEVNFQTGDISAKGHVVLTRGDSEWRGESVVGNFYKKHYMCGEFQAKTGVWYGGGDSAAHQQNGNVVVKGGTLSTCDRSHPHYHISARKVVHYGNGKFRAYNAVAKLGPVPIFYWPVLFGDTNADAGNIEIKPGYSSDWGAFLLLGRHWNIGSIGRTKLMLELRTKRGIAVGNRTKLRGDSWETDFLAYGMHDLDTPETTDNFNRRFDTVDDRYRVRLYHRQDLAEGLTLRARLDALSDVDMLEDWFKREYRENAQSVSYADVTYDRERYSLSLSVRPRVNDFYTVSERLPEVRLEMPRQSLGGLPVFYESSTTAGYYSTAWRDFDLADQALGAPLDADDYRSWRVDTLHSLYGQIQLFDGMVNLIPRGSIRLTHYSESNEGELTDALLARLVEHDESDYGFYPISGSSLIDYDSDGGGLTRLAGELGLEASTKLYRVWENTRSPLFDLDGVRHVLRPYVNYTYLPEPSEDKENILFFDEVDRISEHHFVRLGASQSLQTRRKGRVYTFARMQSYADFHFKRQEYYAEDEQKEEHGSAGSVANKIEIMPVPSQRFWHTIVADMDIGEVTRNEVGVQLGEDCRKSFSLSYLFRSDHYARTSMSMGSSLVDLTDEGTFLARHYDESHTLNAEIRLPINELTFARARLSFDLMEGCMSGQLYEVLRDLHCWMGGLQFVEDNGEYQVLLVLYLKAFPQVGIHATE
ncbi:MAG: LPS assembly protein LptD [Lentisphaeria bacterium]|nr:LPS assembly protein LptD [Lentisphaeria bacterium]